MDLGVGSLFKEQRTTVLLARYKCSKGLFYNGMNILKLHFPTIKKTNEKNEKALPVQLQY